MLEQLPDAVGHALRNQRAGLDQIASTKIGLRAGMGAIEVRTLAFVDHAPIPARYTADGEGLSPPLQWSGVPAGAASLVLIVEDADSPTPQPLVHAIVVRLSAAESTLTEGALDSPDHIGIGLATGKNSYLQAHWLPPDPPPGHGAHRYVFQLFALNSAPDFSESPGRDEVIRALNETAIASGSLIGTYERPDGSIKEEANAADPVSFGGRADADADLSCATVQASTPFAVRIASIVGTVRRGPLPSSRRPVPLRWHR